MSFRYTWLNENTMLVAVTLIDADTNLPVNESVTATAKVTDLNDAEAVAPVGLLYDGGGTGRWRAKIYTTALDLGQTYKIIISGTVDGSPFKREAKFTVHTPYVTP